jgi:hypothetical protein
MWLWNPSGLKKTWCFYHVLDVALGECGEGAKAMYFVVLLEKLGGLCCGFLGLGLVLHNSHGVEGQVDLGWCSHVVVVFV